MFRSGFFWVLEKNERKGKAGSFFCKARFQVQNLRGVVSVCPSLYTFEEIRGKKLAFFASHYGIKLNKKMLFLD